MSERSRWDRWVGGGVRSMGRWWLMGGLLLAGTVMHRLGLEALIDETVACVRAGRRVRGRVRKVLSLVASMLVGGRCHRRCAAAAWSGSRGGGAALWGGGAVDCGVVFDGRSRSGMCAVSQLDKAAELGLVPGVVCDRRGARR